MLMFQPLARYAQFDGRARRAEFWQWVLFRILLGGAIAAVLIYMAGQTQPLSDTSPVPLTTHYLHILPVIGVIQLLLFLPTLAVAIRRLHDAHHTGWWLLLPHIVGSIGIATFFATNGERFAGLMTAGEDMSAAQVTTFASHFVVPLGLMVVLPVVVSKLILLVFFLTPGSPDSNPFGPDPKHRNA